MSKSRPALDPPKLRFITWGAQNIDSTTTLGIQANAEDCIDTTGQNAANSDSSFTVETSEGTVTFLLQESTTTDSVGAASQITIGVGSVADDAVAADIIDAVNGTTNANVAFATSGAGTTGLVGITAAEGSSNTEITLTKNSAGVAGNATAAVVRVSGVAALVQNAAGSSASADFTGGTNARSWTDSLHPLTETDSGAVILVNDANRQNGTTNEPKGAFRGTDGKVFTLPSVKKGMYFKFVWGVADGTGNASVDIKSASTSELIKGTVIAYDSGNADNSAEMTVNQLNGSSHDEIQLEANIGAGSYLELVSDGDHWFVVDSKILTNEGTQASAVTEN